jgi:hypothetical protein
MNNTEPAPLDFGGDKSEIRNKIQNPTPARPVGPSSNYGGGGFGGSIGGGYRPGGGGSTYQPGGGVQKPRVDSPKEFSDMRDADQVQDDEISRLRKDAYRLSNIEKEYDIVHKNDFNKIIKIVMIVFALVVLLCFMILIGVVAYTSIKTGTMTETGIMNGILQFIADVMRIGLS